MTLKELEKQIQNMGEIYNSLEGELLRVIIRRLNKGHSDILFWQAQKLQELRLFNEETVGLLSKATALAEPQINQLFEEVGIGAIKDIDKAVPFSVKPVPNNLDVIMKGYREQAMSGIENYVNQSLITTHYGVGTAQMAYTKVLNETSSWFNAGIHTFDTALERSITRLAQKGIDSGLVDRAGRRWSLEGYVRGVLKSTLTNTFDIVRKERMAEYEIYTVVVTSHAGARPACSIIQGNVVDLRPPEELPEDSKYKSIYDPYWGAEYGTPGGHRGVNCRHLHIPFVPGVNTNNQPIFDRETNEKVKVARDKQRSLERDIVRYKKNRMISAELGSPKVEYWEKMIRKKQKDMREHLEHNGEYLSRDYSREKVYTPLETLMQGVYD